MFTFNKLISYRVIVQIHNLLFLDWIGHILNELSFLSNPRIKSRKIVPYAFASLAMTKRVFQSSLLESSEKRAYFLGFLPGAGFFWTEGISKYLAFYNQERPHQSLDCRTLA